MISNVTSADASNVRLVDLAITPPVQTTGLKGSPGMIETIAQTTLPQGTQRLLSEPKAGIRNDLTILLPPTKADHGTYRLYSLRDKMTYFMSVPERSSRLR